MKALMDEVRFEEGGVVVHMRKGAGKALGNDALEELAEVGQLSDYDSKSILRASTREKTYVCHYPSQSRRKVSRKNHCPPEIRASWSFLELRAI